MSVTFQYFTKQYENGTTILTSNKSFIAMGKVFMDNVLTTVILDRPLHHSVTFNIKGEFYHLQEKRRAGFPR
ncbi:ATP-binding protein [Peribacillus loiseleuriae]|uniref:ATP-binding protein n=1 Tax=Peribacillus loiseleuriae TaxID=1679170 RepID=UPI001FE03044|nr:ATP-binding protein [Peribacillus loiseleuriae]